MRGESWAQEWENGTRKTLLSVSKARHEQWRDGKAAGVFGKVMRV